ncbi:hypothetical protein CLAIMM_04440 [Cladophialophora immunda]|nr:hypothetical protein CLAIMM_04440 [Cladophialophora immunda]
MKPLHLRASSLRSTTVARAPITPVHRLASVLPNGQHHRPQPLISSTTTTTTRPQSTSTTQCQQDIQSNRSAQQDRTRIDRQPTEYSKSGTDDAVAAQAVSFSPDSSATADPAESIAQAAEQISDLTNASTAGTSNARPTPPRAAPFNPLEVSPANVEISSTTSELEGAATVRDADGVVPSQSRTYVGTTTQKSKSTTVAATSTGAPRKKVFAGTDTRKDAMPGGAAQDEAQGAGAGTGGGKGPIIRPGSR